MRIAVRHCCATAYMSTQGTTVLMLVGHEPSLVASVYVQGDQPKLASGAARISWSCGPVSSAATLEYRPSSAASCRKASASKGPCMRVSVTGAPRRQVTHMDSSLASYQSMLRPYSNNNKY